MSDVTEENVMELLEMIDSVLCSDNQAAKDALRKFMMVSAMTRITQTDQQDASTVAVAKGPITGMIRMLEQRIAGLEKTIAEMKLAQTASSRKNEYYPYYDNKKYILSEWFEDYKGFK